MGSPALDYIICYRGKYISVETKAGAGVFTPRQKLTADRLALAGAAVFLVNEETGMEAVVLHLDRIKWESEIEC
jgi:hypothetical protein